MAGLAFAIVVSILVDIAIQMNVWRIVGVSGRRAQDLAEADSAPAFAQRWVQMCTELVKP